MTRAIRSFGAFSSIGGVPAFVLTSGSGEVATWHAKYITKQYWVDATEYSTLADFFTNIGATFTRASAATFVGSDGLIQTESSNDIGRLTHTAVASPVALGLLMEPATTNLQTFSEEFNNAAWAKNRVAIVANDAVAPDGTTTADKFTADGFGGFHGCNEAALTIAANTDHVFSVFAKGGTKEFICITYTDLANTEEHIAAVFDLSASPPAVTDTHVGTTSGTILSTSIEEFDNGFWRCTLIGQIARANGDFMPGGAGLASGNTFDAEGLIIYTDSNDWHFWGANCHVGKVGTSYIKDNNTRALDKCVTTFADTPDVPFKNWSTTKGTMVAEWTPTDVIDTAQKYVYICQDAGDDDNESVLLRMDTNDIQGGTTDGGTVCTRMFIGDSSGADVNLGGPIGEQAYWNTNVSDADLDTLSGL